MTPLIQHKKTTPVFYLAFALFTFACFAFSPTAQATPDPGSVGGVFNTADGFNAMPLMSAGTANSAFGAFALFSAVSPNFNTAVGAGALTNNNTANGQSGDGNTAVGAAALFNNINGQGNTAVGAAALLRNTGGFGGNTAVGAMALQENGKGPGNTAVGAAALQNLPGLNSEESQNTAVGAEAMKDPYGGTTNTADAADALRKTSVELNTARGASALAGNTTGYFNIAVGSNAGLTLTTGDNNIDIGNEGVADEANTIRIGTKDTQTATFIAGISGAAAVGGEAVFVTSAGKLGTLTVVSSQRFKDDLKAMDKDSEAIFALKPVTFRYKKDIEASGIRQFGLVAEQVERVAPELVKPDHDGKPYTVRYEAVNAMLLNEFLKEHRKVQRLEKQVEKLTAGLQKVSAQVEMSKPGPRVADSN